MKVDEHRKAIVRALIHGVTKEDRWTAMQDVRPAYGSKRRTEQEEHPKGATQCVVTGLFFVDELSEQCITESNYGPVWMGLWLDCPLRLDDQRKEGHGNTLFPRWLAEVLNEYGLGIEEVDIYNVESLSSK